MNPKKLVKECERALQADPQNLVLRLKLGAALREVGRRDDAVAMYRSVAIAYHNQGRLAQAIAVCKSVLEIEPAQPETQDLLARLDAARAALVPSPGPSPSSGAEATSGDGPTPGSGLRSRRISAVTPLPLIQPDSLQSAEPARASETRLPLSVPTTEPPRLRPASPPMEPFAAGGAGASERGGPIPGRGLPPDPAFLEGSSDPKVTAPERPARARRPADSGAAAERSPPATPAPPTTPAPPQNAAPARGPGPGVRPAPSSSAPPPLPASGSGGPSPPRALPAARAPDPLAAGPPDASPRPAAQGAVPRIPSLAGGAVIRPADPALDLVTTARGLGAAKIPSPPAGATPAPGAKPASLPPAKAAGTVPAAKASAPPGTAGSTRAAAPQRAAAPPGTSGSPGAAAPPRAAAPPGTAGRPGAAAPPRAAAPPGTAGRPGAAEPPRAAAPPGTAGRPGAAEPPPSAAGSPPGRPATPPAGSRAPLPGPPPGRLRAPAPVPEPAPARPPISVASLTPTPISTPLPAPFPGTPTPGVVGEGVSVLRRPYVPVPGQDDEGHTLPTASPRMVGGPGNPTTPISERSLPAVPATPAVPARPSGPAPAGRASAPGPRGAPGAPATPGAEPGAFDETTRLADPFELASRGGPPPEVPGLDFILDGDDGAEPAAAAGDDDDRATRVASDPSQLKTRGGALADTARALAPRDPRPTPSGLDDDTATSVAAPPGGTRPSRSDLSATDVGDAPLGVGVGDDDDGLLVEDTQDRSPGARALPAELLPFSRDDRLLDVEWPRVITGSGPADGDGFDEGAVTNPGAGHPSRPARRPGGGVSTSGDAADAADAAAEAAGRAAADSEPAPKKRITVSRVKSAPDGPETRDDLATQKVERLEPAPLGEPSDGLALASAFEQSFAPASELAPDGSPIERPMPLFSRLGADALRDLRRRMSFRRCAAGDLILREGDPGDACYVVHAGSVRVLKRDPSGSTVDVIEIARLGPGALFGEFAVLADRRRHASVQALEACELYEIPRRLLRELAAEYADVGPALERFFRERLLATLMATAPFFQPLPEEERARLMLRFRPRRITAGESILVEGAPGGGLYLIVLGTVDITRRVDGRRQVLLASLGEGAYFGEMSLLSGGMASATVTAAGSVELAQLTPKDFYDVVAQHPNIWDELRREAARRDLVNQNILAGETAVV